MVGFMIPVMAGAQATATRPAPTPAVATDAEDTLTTKFEVSGIPVILRRVTANNVVAANLYLLGGVRQLTTETQGIENFLLEATERGTAKYPRDVLRGKMALLGARLRWDPAWTGRQSACDRPCRTSIHVGHPCRSADCADA